MKLNEIQLARNLDHARNFVQKEKPLHAIKVYRRLIQRSVGGLAAITHALSLQGDSHDARKSLYRAKNIDSVHSRQALFQSAFASAPADEKVGFDSLQLDPLRRSPARRNGGWTAELSPELALGSIPLIGIRHVRKSIKYKKFY